MYDYIKIAAIILTDNFNSVYSTGDMHIDENCFRYKKYMISWLNGRYMFELSKLDNTTKGELYNVLEDAVKNKSKLRECENVKF